MSFTTYDTHTLLRVVETLTPDIQPYWLPMFPSVVTFDQEYIDFDIVDRQRRLAPFVAPTSQGQIQKALGFTAKRFKPAYVKPKDVIDPARLIRRRAGEALMGSLSTGQRRDAIVTQTLAEHRAMIDRRLEWMAAQAILNGSVTVSGENYPTTVVDFGRNAGHTITLTGTALWTDTVNSDPLANLETWYALVQQKTGYVVDRVTMGVTAWQAFRKHPVVKDALDTRYLGGNANIDRSPLNGFSAREVGRIGNVVFWVYADVYDADDGTATQMLPQDNVVLTASAGIEGIRCFGGILDKANGYQPAVYFPKMWEENDPSVEYLMTQSAPLVVPLRPNCTVRAKVV